MFYKRICHQKHLFFYCSYNHLDPHCVRTQTRENTGAEYKRARLFTQITKSKSTGKRKKQIYSQRSGDQQTGLNTKMLIKQRANKTRSNQISKYTQNTLSRIHTQSKLQLRKVEVTESILCVCVQRCADLRHLPLISKPASLTLGWACQGHAWDYGRCSAWKCYCPFKCGHYVCVLWWADVGAIIAPRFPQNYADILVIQKNLNKRFSSTKFLLNGVFESFLCDYLMPFRLIYYDL